VSASNSIGMVRARRQAPHAKSHASETKGSQRKTVKRAGYPSKRELISWASSRVSSR